MNLRRAIGYIPLIILVGSIGYCFFYVVQTTNILLTGKHYWGIALVLTSLAVSIFKPAIGKCLTALALILGLINLVAFTPIIETYFIGFSLNGIGIDIRIQSFSLFVFVLFLVLNYKEIIFLIRKRNQGTGSGIKRV